MHAFLSVIQGSAVSTWVRESSSPWAYPTILFLHTVGLAIVVGLNVAVDLRVLGAAPSLPLAPMARFFRLMWLGLAVSAASGLVLLASDVTATAVNRTFWIKMLFVVLAVVNMRAMQRRLTTSSGKRLAVASLLLWTAAITAGRLLVHFGTVPGALVLLQRMGR